jgi:hypothetical protein
VSASVQLTSPVLELASVSTRHETAGLAHFPAHDWYAPAGSGHDPALGPLAPHGPFGWSIYVTTAAGVVYYLTHLATRNVVLHSRVARGQRIGSVAPWHLHGLPDHVHMGVSS